MAVNQNADRKPVEQRPFRIERIFLGFRCGGDGRSRGAEIGHGNPGRDLVIVV